ncbi:hypothetical protein [Agromyces ramosus]|uniref:Uncharacterized protein n=1 Tax=Agromyces ramosus TaxID=33879 RepID=A0ABU0R9L4_9MICO|nr:hypothetical protein [Agromyces ramosus]MDQ0893739.1 hypothetical protein [Agromyces ramosus]
MQRIIRIAMLVVSVVGVVTTIVKRFGPRLQEYATATEAFWSNPKVVKAREKAWEQARRARAAQTAAKARQA